LSVHRGHLCDKSPFAIAVTIVAAIAGVRSYEREPQYAERVPRSAIAVATVDIS